jgi:formate dehydrogenase subunit delta
VPIETLIRMCREIARNNAALPPHRVADRIARHLRSFWAPAMIAELQTYAVANPDQLDPVLAAALRQLSSAQ